VIPQSKEEVSHDGWWALRYSFPVWLVQRWAKEFGEAECEAMLAATHDRPPLVIRANSLKITRVELLHQFTAEEGAEAAPKTKWGIQFKGHPQIKNLAAFMEGLFEIQSSASQRVVELIAPRPGEKVWDVCAGAGGKTLFLAALMQNEGQVYATDLRSLAIKELKLRAARAGVENIKAADIQRFYKHEVQERFDKIVVDAPCSGTGTLGRAPDLKWRLEEKSFDEYAGKQLEILEMALPYLKPEGKMYYITCSVDTAENEGVAKAFLSRHPDMQLCELEGYPEGCVRIWPHKDHTDGFFMACFTRSK
jgi:16S rRNA (cytosine967-C5)-methyltransferase